MRLLYHFSILLICCHQSLSAQSIAAGQHGPGQYFVDIQPDTTIIAPYLLPDTYGMYALDMNGDDTVDYELHVANVGGLGIHFNRCYIEPKNNNEVAVAHTDSCFYTDCGSPGQLVGVTVMVRAFEYGELIDNNAQWADSLVYLSYNNYSGGCFYCSGHTFESADTNYIGVRYFLSADTVYGWIKVSGISDINCTIESFAVEYATTGTKEVHTGNASVKVSPNPASGSLRFDFGRPLAANAVLDIWDNMGRPVMRQELETNMRTFNCDVASFASGVYFYSIRLSGRETISGKFIAAD